MHSRFVIFAVSAVLLVPFVYATSSLPDVCAVPASDNYVTSKDCTGTLSGDGIRTCCWVEKDANGKEVDKCQACSRSTDKDGDPVLFCGPVLFPGSLKPELSGTVEEGGIIEGNTTSPDIDQKRGVFKERTDSNNTFSQDDIGNLE
jgi:hypothetical protein